MNTTSILFAFILFTSQTKEAVRMQLTNETVDVASFSGVVINYEGEPHILTCAHPIKEMGYKTAQADVMLNEGYYSVPVKLVKVDLVSDLALFKIGKLYVENVTRYELGEMPENNTECRYVGYPNQKFVSHSVTYKDDTSYLYKKNNKLEPLITVIQQINRGGSGGALLHDNKIIGILSASNASIGSSFVHLNDIKEFLENK